MAHVVWKSALWRTAALAAVVLGFSVVRASGQSDVLTVGSVQASGAQVAVPISLRDASGTTLGVDQSSGHRIQAISFRLNIAPASMVDVANIVFQRTGVLGGLTPVFETAPIAPSSVAWIATFDEATDPIPFTSDATAPGDLILEMVVPLTASAVPGSTITLTVDPSHLVTSLYNVSGTEPETTANGELSLVDGEIFVPPVVSIDDASVSEGNTGTVNAAFSVRLSAAVGRTVTVEAFTADGNAQAGEDYTSLSGTVVSFAPGETDKTLPVAVKGDSLDEPDETFQVELRNVSNASLGDALGTGTIVDDDPAPSLSISDLSSTEGDSGTVSAEFTVSLSAASGKNVTVSYATSDSTAVAPADYTATTGSLSFRAGVTSQTVTVFVKGDTLDEPDETFHLDLSDPGDAVLGDGLGIGTILDDDPLAALSIGDTSVNEGDSETVIADFSVHLSPASGKTVSVEYATSEGTATQSDDYTAVPATTLTFAPGETMKIVSVAVLGDVTMEDDEDFFVDLSNPVNATIAEGRGAGTILDDDVPPGDANGDGVVTVGDLFYLINNLFAGGPAPVGDGDVNGDGSVTVSDLFYLINYLFAGGPAPV